MSKICDISAKRPRTGNKVSHANNKTKSRFLPNLQKKRFYYPEGNTWLTLRVSTQVIRTINKNGLSTVLRQAKAKGTLNEEVLRKQGVRI